MAGESVTLTARSQKVKTGVEVLVIVLAFIACMLRFYTRRFTKVGLGYDDWSILAAVCCTLATAALLVAGMIRHDHTQGSRTDVQVLGTSIDPNGMWAADNTTPDYVYTSADVLYLKLSYVSSILYFTIASATQLGILLMYNRLFSVDRSFRLRLYVASALVVGFWIGTTVASFTSCIPLKWSWTNGLVDSRYCSNYNMFWMVSGVCEVFLDVIILALPVPTVWRLQMSMRRKAYVLFIFSLGGFAVLTGIVRVVLGDVHGSRVPSYLRTEVWATVHVGLAIICACLPVLRPLLARVSQVQSQLVAKLSRSSSDPSPPSSRRHSGFRWSTKRNHRAHNRDNSKSALLEKSLISTLDIEAQEDKNGAVVSEPSRPNPSTVSPSPTIPLFTRQTLPVYSPPPSPPAPESTFLLRSPLPSTTISCSPRASSPRTQSASISRRPVDTGARPPLPLGRQPQRPERTDDGTKVGDLPSLTRLTLNLQGIPMTLDGIPYCAV